MTAPALTLHITCAQDCLLGGDAEAALELAHWGTWGAHRSAAQTRAPVPAPGAAGGPLIKGPFQWPPAAAVLGDEAVWLQGIATTRLSGVAVLDATDLGHVDRDLLVGTARIPLRQALAAAHAGTTLQVPLVHRMLEAQLTQQQHQQPLSAAQVAAAATKAVLTVRPVLTGGGRGGGVVTTAALAAALEAKQAPDAPLHYDHPKFDAAHARALELTVVEGYSPTFFARANGGAPDWPLGAEKSVEQLHLPRYVNDQGSQPPVAFLLHDVETRDHPPGSDIRQHQQHYALTPESAAYHRTLLQGALDREGLTAAQFCAAVDTQERETGATVHDDYLRACKAMADAGTYVANALYYKMDGAYTTTGTGAGATPTTPASTKASVVAAAATAAVGKVARLERLLVRTQRVPPPLAGLWLARYGMHKGRGGRARLCAGEATATATSVVGAAATPAKYALTELESFDVAPVQGLVNSGDCEDMSNMGSTVLRQFPRVATVAPADPLVAAAAKIGARRFVMDAAASVTAAFVNTEGKELSTDELKGMKDLPLMGSPEDVRKLAGGHCHGLWPSRATTYAMLGHALGAAKVDADLPLLAAEAKRAPAWTRALPTLVLEGTSSIEPLVLPPGEVSKEEGERALARRDLVKSLKAASPALLDTFKVEGLSFYSTPQDPQRLVSSFYLAVSQLMCPELYAMDPRYGQMGAVDTAAKTRGVPMGTFLRAALSGTDAGRVGLVPSFGREMTRAQWDTDVRPVMALVQNQMALNGFARFATPLRPRALAYPAAARVNNHTLDAAALQSFASLAPSKLAGALEQHSRVLATATRLNADMPGKPGTAATTTTITTTTFGALRAVPAGAVTLCLYTRPWRLALPLKEEGGKATTPTPTRVAAVEKELAQLKAEGRVLDWQYVHDRPLPHANDVLTLRLVLPAVAPPLPPEPATAAAVPTKHLLSGGVRLMTVPFWAQQ